MKDVSMVFETVIVSCVPPAVVYVGVMTRSASGRSKMALK